MRLTIACLLALLVPAAAAQADVTVSYTPNNGLRIQGDTEADGISVAVVTAGSYRVVSLATTFVATSDSDCADGPGNGVVVDCTVSGSRVIDADLGAGNDQLLASVTADLGDMFINGETGNDTLRGGKGFDAIDAGAGNDVTDGGPGDDLLEGGDGDDTFTGDSGGTDTVRGEAGKDTLVARSDSLAGADRFDGGEGGRDKADYSIRTESVKLSINTSSAPNDGRTGEQDDLDNVEIYVTGSGNDQLRAFDFFNERSVDLFANAGADLLFVDGDEVSADLDGGIGADTFEMSGHSHVVAARDGEKDTFICSPAIELIVADLRDPPLPTDCGPLAVGAVDENPNVSFRSKRAALHQGGRLSVKLHCPRQNTEPCAGTLEARLDRRGTAFGSDADYSIRPGRSATVSTRLRRGQRRGASRRRARVRLQSIETGLHGPKTTTTSLPVRVLTRSGG